MASPSGPRLRDVSGDTLRDIQILQETFAESARDTAQTISNVTLKDADAFQQAKELVGNTYRAFTAEVNNRYHVPPWSTVAEMVIRSSKSQYFFASPGLLDDIFQLIQGKQTSTIETSSSSETWDFE